MRQLPLAGACEQPGCAAKRAGVRRTRYLQEGNSSAICHCALKCRSGHAAPLAVTWWLGVLPSLHSRQVADHVAWKVPCSCQELHGHHICLTLQLPAEPNWEVAPPTLAVLPG